MGNSFYQKIVSEQEKGFVRRDLSDEDIVSLMALEEGLQGLEAAFATIPPAVLSTLLTWRFAHADMFMEDILADQIRSGTISRYTVGWADNAPKSVSTVEQLVGEDSEFSLWAEHPFMIVVRELGEYPLLGFLTPGAYVTFTFLLRAGRYDDAILCLNGRKRRSERDSLERELFDDLFREPVSASDFQLILFLLYRALWSSFSSGTRANVLRGTLDDQLRSAIRFPEGLNRSGNSNWYGDLLMKVRHFIKQ